MTSRTRILSLAALMLVFQLTAMAQAPAAKTRKVSPKPDPAIEARRTMAVSLVTSLAEEARSFRDLVLRARVQGRSADLLWDTDPEAARALFRRAWESAENADDENAKRTDEQRRSLLSVRGTTVRR